ncbi:MAG: regulatory protein RecX [Xanthomonadaceae bacterium]|nr:regulatory protein RecX [Xanthomonadaceae bacterium]
MNLKAELERYVMFLLSKREYATKDLVRCTTARAKLLLKKNKVETEVRDAVIEKTITELIEKLTRLGMLSDERYMRMMVRHQVGRKLGFRAISLKLKQKGITLTSLCFKELMSDEGVTDTNEHDVGQILELVKRKYPGYSKDYKIKTRAFGFLVRRGFSIDLIQKALKLDES